MTTVDEADLGTVRRRHARLGRVPAARLRHGPRGQRRRPGPGLAAHDPRDRRRRGRLDLRALHAAAAARTTTTACGSTSSSSGWCVFASILMLRQPLFFIFMIAGFFYATALRPLPLAVVGIAATSILVNTLIAGLPQNAEAWTFYLAIIVVQTIAISAGAVVRREGDRAERGAPRRPRPARGRPRGERRASTPSC